MNRIKITPLTVTAALCLLMAIWIPFAPETQPTQRSGINVPWIMPLLFVIGACVAFSADWLIRKYTSDLKKVWTFELLIVCTIILYSLLIK